MNEITTNFAGQTPNHHNNMQNQERKKIIVECKIGEVGCEKRKINKKFLFYIVLDKNFKEKSSIRPDPNPLTC